jgi:hypothetical protein
LLFNLNWFKSYDSNEKQINAPEFQKSQNKHRFFYTKKQKRKHYISAHRFCGNHSFLKV